MTHRRRTPADGQVLLEIVRAYLRHCSATRTAARVSELAQFASFDRSHLTRDFRRALGLPAGDVLRAEQVRQAAQLLALTNMTNEEIAAHTGFGTRNTFQRQFTKRIGMTPAEYRRLHSRSAAVPPIDTGHA